MKMASTTLWVRAGVSAIAILGFALAQWYEIMALWWVGLVFFVICLLMFARTLLRSLVHMRKVTPDLLVITVMVVTFLDGEPLSGVLVAWFISAGLAISLTIIERTHARIRKLTGERNKIIRVMRQGIIKEMSVEDTQPGDIVIVPQGELIPVDGVVFEGNALVDESVVTGEPFPVHKAVGSQVISGSLALSGTLQVEASRAGDKAFLYQMETEIQNALQIKTDTHKTADKIVQFFIPCVVLYGLFVLLITGELNRMATIVSIACPCAWALATPTAFAAVIGSLAGQGILARGGTPLEVIGEADIIVFDKTGTVTLGNPQAESVTAFNISEDQLLQIAASVEANFNHPIANAIVSYAAERDVHLLEVQESHYIPGQGVRAIVQQQQVVLGAAGAMEEAGIPLPEKTTMNGRATWVAIEGEIAGAIVIQDVIREYAHALGNDLRARGIREVVLATGDSEEGEARRVADIIGADEYYWRCKPEDKVELIKRLKTSGKTIMVGDGINDSTSLAVADVGIAIGAKKADMAIHSSDIIVQREDASSLLTVLTKGKKLRKVIKQNYLWALGFNLTGILLATFGILSPPLAAVLHHFSSVFVVGNSTRLIRKENG